MRPAVVLAFAPLLQRQATTVPRRAAQATGLVPGTPVTAPGPLVGLVPPPALAPPLGIPPSPPWPDLALSPTPDPWLPPPMGERQGNRGTGGATWEVSYDQGTDPTVRSSAADGGVCWAATTAWARAHLIEQLDHSDHELREFRLRLKQRQTADLVQRQLRYGKWVRRFRQMAQGHASELEGATLAQDAEVQADIKRRMERLARAHPACTLSGLLLKKIGGSRQGIPFNTYANMARGLSGLVKWALSQGAPTDSAVFLVRVIAPHREGSHEIGLRYDAVDGGSWTLFDANVGEISQIPDGQFPLFLAQHFTSRYGSGRAGYCGGYVVVEQAVGLTRRGR